MCAQMLMYVIVYGGCSNTVRPVLKADSGGENLPCHTELHRLKVICHTELHRLKVKRVTGQALLLVYSLSFSKHNTHASGHTADEAYTLKIKNKNLKP